MDKKKITAKQFFRRYEKGERDFQHILLEYADLSGAELQGIEMGGAQFNYVNLSGIKLKDCNLSATFTYCNFTNAKIASCNLESTRFFNCDFTNATLTSVNLTSTYFTRVNLQRTRTSGFGESPCRFRDVIREDGVFVPGFTFDLYIKNNFT